MQVCTAVIRMRDGGCLGTWNPSGRMIGLSVLGLEKQVAVDKDVPVERGQKVILTPSALSRKNVGSFNQPDVIRYAVCTRRRGSCRTQKHDIDDARHLGYESGILMR